MSKEGACPLCQGPQNVKMESQNFVLYVDCPRCGGYGATQEFVRFVLELPSELKQNERASLVIATRNHSGPGRLVLTEENYREIIAGVRIPRLIEERINLILQKIADRSDPLGTYVPFDAQADHPLYYCRSADELRYLLTSLTQKGWVREHQTPPSLLLTPEGVSAAQQLVKEIGSGKLVFVAMSFDEEERDLFEEVFVPVCKDLGYEAFRVDRGHDLGKIDDAIVAGIRSAGFVIADYTKNKSGVYYETGFAHALGKPVILTCPKSMLTDNTLHFDINHYSFLSYATRQELALKLKDRIRAKLGPFGAS
jgi:hypothetical protein